MRATETIRILLIDDDQGDFEMARAMIAQIDRPETEYRVDWVSSYEEGSDAFREGGHDVYIVDYFLEDRDGLDLVREARERGIREPVIMLTGRGSHEIDVEAMKAGASDYLVKGRIDPDLLERTIRYALERQRAEAALRDSEERHRSMFDHLPIGLYRVSTDGEFMDANPALVRILGYPDPGTLQSHYASSLYVGPEDRERFAELLRQFGVARGFETVLQRHDGSRVRVRNTARAHRSPDGEIRYLEGAVEDVTDERSARDVRSNAARFDAVYSHAGLPILLVDLEGAIVDANPAFRRTFDYDNRDLEGRPLVDRVPSEDRDGIAEDLRTLAEGRAAELERECRFLGGDGEALWTRVRSTLVRDGSNEPDIIMLFFADVAEEP